MDITRNWRLKTSRSQLLAARDPQTGEVVLPQQTMARAPEVALYTFETAGQPHLAEAEAEADYARAAR